MIEQKQTKLAIFCAQMVRPGHILAEGVSLVYTYHASLKYPKTTCYTVYHEWAFQNNNQASKRIELAQNASNHKMLKMLHIIINLPSVNYRILLIKLFINGRNILMA